MSKTTGTAPLAEDGLEQVNEYLAALARGAELPELDTGRYAGHVRTAAENALALGKLVSDEREQAAKLGRGIFERPVDSAGENPLTESFDGIRTNLAVPWQVAHGVERQDFSFEIPRKNDYLSYMDDVVQQLRNQRIKLENEACTDPLTGLGNRLAYSRDIDRIWDESREHTIAFVDLDGLKHCNDHYGHAEGNRYILEVAKCIDLHRKPDERLYRVGGDEFMVISESASTEELSHRLETCRKTLAPLTMGTGKSSYSFSYGCAHADPADGGSRHETEAKADRRMYAYKLAHSKRARAHRAGADIAHAIDEGARLPGNPMRVFRAMSLTSAGRYLFICDVDADDSLWSSNAVHDFGLPAERVHKMGEIWSKHIHPDDLDAWTADIDAVFSGKKHHHNLRYRAKNAAGEYVMVTCTGVRLDGDAEAHTLFVGSITNSSIAEGTDPATGLDDVRALVAYLDDRRKSGYPTDIVAFKIAGLDRVNTLHGFEAGNRALSAVIGRILSGIERPARLFRSYGLEFVLVFDSQPGLDPARVAESIRALAKAPIEVGGAEAHLSIHAATSHHAVIAENTDALLSDLNRRIDAELQSRTDDDGLASSGGAVHTARRDRLTGLMRGNDFLHAANLHRPVNDDEARVIVAIDLGRMRIFNEWYGHQAGDALIAEVGRCLQTVEARGKGFAGYWGQDDFAVYISDERKAVESLYLRIRGIVASRDDSVGFLPAFGVCPVKPGQRIDISLYDRAKSALELTRNDFKQRIKYFQPENYAKREDEHRLLSAFQRALNRGEVIFHVQPQYNIAEGRIAGGEALARWRQEDGSYISPGLFVPLLERNGFVVTLDRHIWNLAFAWLHNRLSQGKPCVPISINVSKTDLISLDVADHLDRLAMHYDVPTRYVKVEVTESAYAESPEAVIEFTGRLHALGFSVYIDDFGSGSSSLSMLQRIDADAIKLDGRFMSLEPASPGKGENIITSVINMTWKLGLPAVIEGVETEAQAAFLRKLGCRYVQGFLYFRPMPAEDFENLLDDGTPLELNGIAPPPAGESQRDHRPPSA